MYLAFYVVISGIQLHVSAYTEASIGLHT